MRCNCHMPSILSIHPRSAPTDPSETQSCSFANSIFSGVDQSEPTISTDRWCPSEDHPWSNRGCVRTSFPHTRGFTRDSFSYFFRFFFPSPVESRTVSLRMSSAAHVFVRSMGTRDAWGAFRLVRGRDGVASYVRDRQLGFGWTPQCAPRTNHTHHPTRLGGYHTCRTNSPWNGTRWYETGKRVSSWSCACERRTRN